MPLSDTESAQCHEGAAGGVGGGAGAGRRGAGVHRVRRLQPQEPLRPGRGLPRRAQGPRHRAHRRVQQRMVRRESRLHIRVLKS